MPSLPKRRNCSVRSRPWKQNKLTLPAFPIKPEELDRVIEMAWEDRTPFDAIYRQFGVPEQDVIRLMRSSLKPGSFRAWRKRVNQGVSMKHEKKRSPEVLRFRSSRQRSISGNRISKRP